MARKSFQNLRVHSGILIDEMKNILACTKLPNLLLKALRKSLKYSKVAEFPNGTVDFGLLCLVWKAGFDYGFNRFQIGFLK